MSRGGVEKGTPALIRLHLALTRPLSAATLSLKVEGEAVADWRGALAVSRSDLDIDIISGQGISVRYMKSAKATSQTRFAILGMLTLGPMTGYDLKKKSERSLAHFWHESYGNLYPRLAELEEAGLVRSRREAREGRPDAIMYTITARGRRELSAWLEEPAAPEKTRSELQLRIFFGAQAPLEQSIEQISAYREQQQALRETYASLEEGLRAEIDAGVPDAPFQMITLRRGQQLTATRLRWCREALQALESMRQNTKAS